MGVFALLPPLYFHLGLPTLLIVHPYPTNMGYEIGAVKYFIGMLTSVWGVITAYLFANGLLNPMDYVQAVGMVADNPDSPDKMLNGLLEIFITTPSDFIGLVLIGLTTMTVSWYVASKSG